MSVETILEKPHYRRSFYISLVALLTLLLVLRRFYFGSYQELEEANSWSTLFLAVVDGLISSAIVTVGLGWLLFQLTPPSVRKAEVRILAPTEIGKVFEAALASTDRWWFKGNCGRYLRSVSLPRMAARAREQSCTADVYAVFLDPSNAEACSSYASYRGSVHSAAQGDEWTQERVQREALATLFIVLATMEHEPLLRLQVGLSPQFSSFRLDLSEQNVVITKEDRRAPAVCCDAGTFFYNAYRDEIVLAHKQTRRISSSGDCPPVEKLSLEVATEVLRKVGLPVADLGQETIEGAISTAKLHAKTYG